MAVGNKFGWHSGTLTCKDAKVRGDLYVQDDIVFSDVTAGTLGVTGGIDMSGTTSAIGIDLGGTYSTAAVNIDGSCGAGINITLEDDLSVSATYNKAIYSVQTLTGEDAADGGGLQGIRSDTNNSTYDNSWQVSVQGRATATGTATVGDTIGVYAAVKTVGALTDVSSGTGSLCAFKGDVSDSPGSSWDANVHGVMIGYASQINYGGKTSLFFGYTHATARCDYGLLIDTYSPYGKTAINLAISDSGKWLGDGLTYAAVMQYGSYSTAIAYGTQTGHLVMKSTHISADTGAYYVFGDIMRITTSDDSTGYMNCGYDYLSVGHDLVNGWATRGRLDITDTCELGEMAGILGTLDIAASKTITANGSAILAAGILSATINANATVAQDVTCLEIRPIIRKEGLAGTTSGIRVNINCSSENYLDYGIDILSMSRKQTAAIRILATPASDYLKCAIHMEGQDSGTSVITNALSFAGTVTNILDFAESDGSQGVTIGAAGDATVTADAKIQIDIAGDTYYIPAYKGTFTLKAS